VPGSSRRLSSPRWRRSWTARAGALADPSRSRMLCRPFATTVLIADASVLVVALADDGPDGDQARARLRGESLALPELADLEVVSVLRRQLLAGAIDARRAGLALNDLAVLPARRAPHRPLLARCWELRANLTPYDATYVALAEALEATLLTGDQRLARAPGPRCPIEIFQPVQ
jgi:predicted nucleic acid-binding protein